MPSKGRHAIADSGDAANDHDLVSRPPFGNSPVLFPELPLPRAASLLGYLSEVHPHDLATRGYSAF